MVLSIVQGHSLATWASQDPSRPAFSALMRVLRGPYSRVLLIAPSSCATGFFSRPQQSKPRQHMPRQWARYYTLLGTVEVLIGRGRSRPVSPSALRSHAIAAKAGKQDTDMAPIPVMFWRVPPAQHDVKWPSGSSLLPSQLAQWHDELACSLASTACWKTVT